MQNPCEHNAIGFIRTSDVVAYCKLLLKCASVLAIALGGFYITAPDVTNMIYDTLSVLALICLLAALFAVIVYCDYRKARRYICLMERYVAHDVPALAFQNFLKSPASKTTLKDICQDVRNGEPLRVSQLLEKAFKPICDGEVFLDSTDTITFTYLGEAQPPSCRHGFRIEATRDCDGEVYVMSILLPGYSAAFLMHDITGTLNSVPSSFSPEQQTLNALREEFDSLQ